MSRRADLIAALSKQQPGNSRARRAAAAAAADGIMATRAKQTADKSTPPQAAMTYAQAFTMTATDFEAFRAKVSELQGRPVGKDEIMQALRDAPPMD